MLRTAFRTSTVARALASSASTSRERTSMTLNVRAVRGSAGAGAFGGPAAAARRSRRDALPACAGCFRAEPSLRPCPSCSCRVPKLLPSFIRLWSRRPWEARSWPARRHAISSGLPSRCRCEAIQRRRRSASPAPSAPCVSVRAGEPRTIAGRCRTRSQGRRCRGIYRLRGDVRRRPEGPPWRGRGLCGSLARGLARAERAGSVASALLNLLSTDRAQAPCHALT